jgi:hypothetical protein
MSPPTRLEREMPAAGQAGCATAIGVFLTIVGSIITFAMRSNADQASKNEWVVYAVGGGFAVVGLVMISLGIKMALMIRLPETIVEVNKNPVRKGESFQMTIRQPGPMHLKSLRVNFVAEQITTFKRKGQKHSNTDRRLIHEHNVLDMRDVTIAAGEEMTRHADITVPADVNVVDIEGKRTVVWRLEVWGRVRGWVDFGHPFVIDVAGFPVDKHDAVR